MNKTILSKKLAGKHSHLEEKHLSVNGGDILTAKTQMHTSGHHRTPPAANLGTKFQSPCTSFKAP